MFATLLLLATAVGADSLAEARAGKIQCITPNHENGVTRKRGQVQLIRIGTASDPVIYVGRAVISLALAPLNARNRYL